MVWQQGEKEEDKTKDKIKEKRRPDDALSSKIRQLPPFCCFAINTRPLTTGQKRKTDKG